MLTRFNALVKGYEQIFLKKANIIIFNLILAKKIIIFPYPLSG